MTNTYETMIEALAAKLAEYNSKPHSEADANFLRGEMTGMQNMIALAFGKTANEVNEDAWAALRK